MRTANPIFLISIVNYARTLGNEISLHSANPGVSGAAEIDTNRQTTSWGPARINADDIAECIGSPCAFELKHGTTCTHFGVWSGSQFLYGAPIDPPVTVEDTGGDTIVLTPSYQQVAQ